MNPDTVQLVLYVCFWSLLVPIAACMVVVLIGPGNVDRLVATDLGLMLIGVDLTLFSAAGKTTAYMDAALLMAILAFLVTVAVARLLESGQVFR